MNKMFKKVLVVALGATMVASMVGCGGAPAAGSSAAKSSAAAGSSAAAAAPSGGKVKIGVSIWSSTDVLGSQCKKIIDEAAKALGDVTHQTQR